MASAELTALPWSKPVSDPHGALIELMTQHQDRLHGFVVSIFGSEHGTSDCVQETFLQAFQMLSKGRSVNRQWLYRAARHRALDELRRRTCARLSSVQPEDVPDRTVEPSIETSAVKKVLGKMTESDRSLLYLSGVDGMKSVDIAKVMGMRAGTIRVRLHRAHIRFKTIYADLPSNSGVDK